MAKSARKSPRKKRRGKASARWPWLLGSALVVLTCGIGFLKWSQASSGKAVLLEAGSTRMHGDVQAAVEGALLKVLPGLAPGPAVRPADRDRAAPELGAEVVVRCRTVAVADDRPWIRIQLEVDAALSPVGARVLWGERLRGPGASKDADYRPDDRTDVLRLDLGVSGRATHTLLLHRAGDAPRVAWDEDAVPSAWQEFSAAPAPTVAIIIDDWGNGRTETTRRILDLDAAFTLAVLPALPYSRHFALKGTDLVLPGSPGDQVDTGDDQRSMRRKAGCPVELTVHDDRPLPHRRREVILHWPMQPESVWDPGLGRYMVYVAMDSETIGTRLDGALAGLPSVRGVNNHMGSAATSDAETMTELMEVLRERDLYFVDSLTSSRSVALETAQAHGVPALRNRVFLDADTSSAERVRAKLEVLVRSAREQGFAVGIGHPHPLTAEVLARELPRLKAEGIRFVTVSEMMALQRAAAGNRS